MKVKNYKCKCGNDDFKIKIKSCVGVESKIFFHTGLYCTYCGAFLKWANKEEKRLFDMKEGEKDD